ncbi:MAG: DnaD domain protein [Dehalococcoidia bacterium]|nr:DnaD domain protein [Dehalococcoidia bacterium]
MLEAFSGFPSRTQYTPLPNLFFSTVLPEIDDIGELKAVLHIFWLLHAQKGYPRFVTRKELERDPVLRRGLGSGDGSPVKSLQVALELAVSHGLLLQVDVGTDDRQETLYLTNNESNRDVVTKIRSGVLSLGEMKPQSAEVSEVEERDIFSLYEQNIGMLTPLIAEELKEAESLYPAEWIREAFREAVTHNKRNWRYIGRILERWALEGKDHGKAGRDTEKAGGQDKYVRGKYGHLVRR